MMKSISERISGWILLIISALFSYLIIVPYYFPYVGIGLSLVILAILVFVVKTKPSPFDAFLLGVILILSVFVFTRSYPFLVFLDIVTILLLGSWLTIRVFDESVPYLIRRLITAPVMLIGQSITTANNFPLRKATHTPTIAVNRSRIREWVISFAITFLLLLLVLPLLASANPFFERGLNDIVSLLSLSRLYDWIEQMFNEIVLLRIVFFSMLVFFLPRMLSRAQLTPTASADVRTQNLPLMLPKLVLSVILVLFFITQGQLYFSSDATLQSLGYTHSQYAREVFAQLTIVAGVIVALMYNDRSGNRINRLLSYVLIVEGLFLSFMALKSVHDYSMMWGFTHKRLWGYTGVLWILAALLLFGYKYWQKISDHRWVKWIVVLSTGILVAVNVINFDDLIYRYRQSTTQEGVDYGYLSRLSSDAHAYDNIIDDILKVIEDPSTLADRRMELVDTAWLLVLRIDELNEKYQKLDWRAFNLSEYYQYVQLKQVDLNSIRSKLAAYTPDPSLYPWLESTN